MQVITHVASRWVQRLHLRFEWLLKASGQFIDLPELAVAGIVESEDDAVLGSGQEVGGDNGYVLKIVAHSPV